ncbi:MAG: DMT family transporter [Pseudomonadota bacterium]
MTLTLSTRQASFAVLIAAVIWGLYWVPLRYLEGQGLSGARSVILLNLPAALGAAAWALAAWRVERAHLAHSVQVGIAAGLGLGLFSLAVLETSVIRATLLFYLLPVWATILGFVFLGERAGLARWIAIAMGLAGLALLLVGSDGVAFNFGDFLALLSGMAWAVSGALLKRRGSVPVGTMLAVQFTFICLLALTLAPYLSPQPSFGATPLVQLLPIALGAAFLGILPAMLMIAWASQFLFPGRVGLLLMAEVAVAVITASLFLPDEVLAPLQWGAVVLIVGAALVELIPMRRQS